MCILAGTTAPPCLYPALLGACSDESVPPPCFNSDVRIFQGSEMKTQSTETTEMLSSDRRNAACFHMKQCWHCCGLTVHSRGTEEPEAGLERLPTLGKSVKRCINNQMKENKLIPFYLSHGADPKPPQRLSFQPCLLSLAVFELHSFTI